MANHKLLVLSVDALFYKDMEFIRDMPNFKKIFDQGSYVRGMRSIYPTLTYPCHVAIMCSRYPAESGIFHNEKLDPGNPAPAWYWWYKDLQCKTILDYAKEHGLTTAAFHWPVLGGCPNVDYLLAEIWSREPACEDQDALYADVCSKTVMDEVYEKYKRQLVRNKTPYFDEFACLCAEDVIRKHKPDITMIHLSLVDHVRHEGGLYTQAVREALASCDGRLGRLLQAYEDAEILEDTNIIVLGDHGHLAVDTLFHPNVVFAKEGLIDVDEHGRIRDYKAYCNSAALSCQVVLKDPADEAVRRKTEEILHRFELDHSIGVERIFTRKEVEQLYCLRGEFEYVMESCDGFSFGNEVTGDVMTKADPTDYKFSVTSHGHLPDKGNDPAFIACGPDIRQGVVLERGSLLDEAPTFARLLGFEFPDPRGRVLDELIK